jgi:hypothetical protein
VEHVVATAQASRGGVALLQRAVIVVIGSKKTRRHHLGPLPLEKMMYALHHLLYAWCMEKIPTGSYLSFTLRNSTALGILAMAISSL